MDYEDLTGILDEGVAKGVLKVRLEEFGRGPMKVLGRVYDETDKFDGLPEEEKTALRRAMDELRKGHESEAASLEKERFIMAVTMGVDRSEKSS